ncbi:hypothetical protein GCM10020254_84140 [Streptomyces goshikiensis]
MDKLLSKDAARMPPATPSQARRKSGRGHPLGGQARKGRRRQSGVRVTWNNNLHQTARPAGLALALDTLAGPLRSPAGLLAPQRWQAAQRPPFPHPHPQHRHHVGG